MTPDATPPAPRLATLFTIPYLAAPGTCLSCHAFGYWITTAKGKKMLVEVEGTDARQKDPMPRENGIGQAHFATCPQAKDWRGHTRAQRR
jgi:hypothetical protein